MINPASKQQQQQKSAKVFPGLALLGFHVERYDATRRFVINNLVVRCTALEYQLLTCFLQRYNRPITFEDLLSLIDGQASNTPAMSKQSKRKLIKAISELRSKIWPCNLSIVYANGMGYMLLHLPQRALPIHPEGRSILQRGRPGA